VIHWRQEAHSDGLSNGNDKTPIVIAYHLHNLYNAFENIFQNIAAVFDNSDDVGSGTFIVGTGAVRHNGLRPAVIDDATYALDESRLLRYLFRLKATYVGQLEQFIDFLQCWM
jgi:hypothetical protein